MLGLDRARGSAAIAVANDPPLHTCDPDDFRDIVGLEVVAVPHPGRADAHDEDSQGA